MDYLTRPSALAERQRRDLLWTPGSVPMATAQLNRIDAANAADRARVAKQPGLPYDTMSQSVMAGTDPVSQRMQPRTSASVRYSPYADNMSPLSGRGVVDSANRMLASRRSQQQAEADQVRANYDVWRNRRDLREWESPGYKDEMLQNSVMGARYANYQKGGGRRNYTDFLKQYEFEQESGTLGDVGAALAQYDSSRQTAKPYTPRQLRAMYASGNLPAPNDPRLGDRIGGIDPSVLMGAMRGNPAMGEIAKSQMQGTNDLAQVVAKNAANLSQQQQAADLQEQALVNTVNQPMTPEENRALAERAIAAFDRVNPSQAVLETYQKAITAGVPANQARSLADQAGRQALQQIESLKKIPGYAAYAPEYPVAGGGDLATRYGLDPQLLATPLSAVEPQTATVESLEKIYNNLRYSASREPTREELIAAARQQGLDINAVTLQELTDLDQRQMAGGNYNLFGIPSFYNDPLAKNNRTALYRLLTGREYVPPSQKRNNTRQTETTIPLYDTGIY